MSRDTSPTPHRPPDELQSALLDGQLSDEERARAEAELSKNPDAKRLSDELRSVSEAVRALPSESVDADFQESVLSAIDGIAKKRANARPPISSWLRGGGWRPQSRGLAWSAAAVAAALLLMFVADEWQGGDLEVAHKADPSKIEVRQLDRVNKAETTEIEDAVAAEKISGSFRAPTFRAEADEPADPADVALGDASLPASGATASGAIGRGARLAGGERGGRSMASEDELDFGADGRGSEAADGPLGGRGRGGGLGGYGRTGRVGGGMKGGGRRYRETGPGEAGILESNDDAAVYFASVAGAAIQRCVDQGAGVSETEQLVQDLEKYAPQGEPLLVVQCDLSPAAVQTKAFEKMLVRNTIHPARQTTWSESGGGRGGSDTVDLLYDLAREAPDQVVAVVVEATPAQLHAALNDLKADVFNCSKLQVQSNEISLESKKQWYDYGRGNLQSVEQVQTDARGLSVEKSEHSQSPPKSAPNRRIADEEIEASSRPLAVDNKEAPSQPFAVDTAADRADGNESGKEPASSDIDGEKIVERSIAQEGVDAAITDRSTINRRFSLGRAWRVRLAPPDRNRKSHFELLAGTEVNPEKSNVEERASDRSIGSRVSKPDVESVLDRRDETKQQLPKQKSRSADLLQRDRLLAEGRALAVFLLRVVPPANASAAPPATSAPAEP